MKDFEQGRHQRKMRGGGGQNVKILKPIVIISVVFGIQGTAFFLPQTAGARSHNYVHKNIRPFSWCWKSLCVRAVQIEESTMHEK